MTFCIGMNLKQGLIGLSDTLIITGNESINARKTTIHYSGEHPFFLMTSGLRSVRDKALTYFDEYLKDTDERYDKLYKAVNAFADQLRRVKKEDNEGLEDTGLNFNLYSIFGGQLENDESPKLFLLYPQGNWVEVGVRVALHNNRGVKVRQTYNRKDPYIRYGPRNRHKDSLPCL